MSASELKSIATQVRRDLLRMVFQAQSGHPGGALGATEILTALYFKIMQHNAQNFNASGLGEDVFFLSNGHLSALWYSVLARSGYFPVSELTDFRKINKRLQGHPSPEKGLPGVRIASGSLGQGISVALGLLESKKLNKDEHFVYCMCGDGELQEGQIWEALMYAAAKKMDRLILMIDWNGQQIDGSTEAVLSLGDLPAKFLAFGFEVLLCEQANDIEKVLTIFNQAKQQTAQGKPIVILFKTVMGYGVDFMMTGHHWHGKAPNSEQLASALAQLPETLGDF